MLVWYAEGMSKIHWTVSIACACIFWGTAILFAQHHLSTLIPALGAYLLAYGVGLLVVLYRHRGKS